MPKTYLVPPAPPHNEGKTPAAWALAVLVLLGCLGVALGMVLATELYLWVGVGLIVLGFVVGFAMRQAGLGQKARR